MYHFPGLMFVLHPLKQVEREERHPCFALGRLKKVNITMKFIQVAGYIIAIEVVRGLGFKTFCVSTGAGLWHDLRYSSVLLEEGSRVRPAPKPPNIGLTPGRITLAAEMKNSLRDRMM